ncbi:hypothetical protein GQ53DRAFT_835174 [Thozetella sp. PMI_491]|nr:hypothetical protein GQ53DRAFT_835174 [Thozetella sp. PMI_491]
MATIDSDLASQGQTIAQKTREVRQGSTKLIDLINERTSCAISSADITDALERFTLWAGNLGAMRAPSTKLSLDSRVSEAPEIRIQICRQLDYLLEGIEDLTSIVQGQRPNRDTTVEIDQDGGSLDNLTSDPTPSDEAHMILELISESLKVLFRVGVLVRKAGPSDRFNRALRASNFAFPATFDIDYVREKHSKLKSDDRNWLAERLGRGIANRRQFIKYCRDHKARLAADEADLDERGQKGTTIHQSSKATTLHVDTLQATNIEDEDDAMSFMSASTTTDALSTLKLPRLAELSKDGEAFECPICFTLQSMKREKTWRAHAFRDLKPYACTMEGTECGSELFGDRNAWFEHELRFHRCRYTCSLCGNDSFPSTSALRSHITRTHSQFSENQLRALEDAGREVPATFRAQECPFCDGWADALRKKREPVASSAESRDVLVSATRFKRHLATHQEQLAIFAIPRANEDDDGGAGESVATRSSVRSQLDTADEGGSENEEQPIDNFVASREAPVHPQTSFPSPYPSQAIDMSEETPISQVESQSSDDKDIEEMVRPEVPAVTDEDFRYITSEDLASGVPAVTDEDYRYITSEDLEIHQRRNSYDDYDHARSAPGAGSGFEKQQEVDDQLLFKINGITYPIKFPAYSIGEGKLLVGDLRSRIQVIMKLSERQAGKMRMLYKGRQLSKDTSMVREYGVKYKSEILVVLDDSTADSDSENSGEVVVVGQDEDEPARRKKKKKRPTKTSSSGREPSPGPTVSASSNTDSGVPGGPIEKINEIASHFTTMLLPLCIQYTASPPSDPKKRANEHRKISEAVLQQVILKLDAVDTSLEEGARARGKQLVGDVQEVLKALDKANE